MWVKEVEKYRQLEDKGVKVTLWILILIASVAAWIFTFLVGLNPLNTIFYGLLLAVIDFIVEALGDYFDLWHSYKSILKILGVPVEVTLTCIFLGSLWALLIPSDFHMIALYVWCTALTGTIIEQILIKKGHIRYGENWSGLHAFITYIIVFSIIAYLVVVG